MTKILKLKVAKEAIEVGLRDAAKVPENARLARELPYMRLKRTTMNDLLDDYDKLLKVAKRAGVKLERPSSKLKGPPLTDSEVPEFLRRDHAEKKTPPPPPKGAGKSKRKRRVKLS